MKPHEHMHSLVVVAEVLGRQLGVEVVFNGKSMEASNDGKRIVLPANLKACANEKERHILEGLIDHEAFHGRHTDFSAKRKADTPLVQAIANALEDVRIEAAGIRQFPGSRRNLRRLVDLVKDDLFAPKEDKGHPANAILGLLLTSHRHSVLGQDTADLARTWRERCKEFLAPSVIEKILGIAESGSRGRSTADVLKAAREIESYLKEEAKNPTQDTDSGKDQGESQGQNQAQNQGQGQGQDESQGTDGGQGQSEGQGQPGASSSQSASAEGVGGGAGASDAEVLKQALGAESGDCQDFSPEQAIQSMTANEYEDSSETLNVQKTTVKGRAVPSSAVQHGIRMVGHKLDLLLESRVSEPVTYGRSGKLDARRVNRIAGGDFNVFSKRDEAVGIDVAVCVLVDSSGSMGSGQWSPMASAKDTAAIIMESIGKYDLPMALGTFNNRVVEIKDFSEAWPRVGASLTSVNAGGGTQMGAGHQWTVRKLAGRNEDRRIALIVTDGAPNSIPALKASVQTAVDFGIETRIVVIGEACNADAMRTVTPHVGYAENATGIPNAIWEALRSSF